MPEALILSLPIVGGFLAVTTLYHRRYQIARDSGYRLYFKIVHYAIILTAAATLATQAVWTASAFVGAIAPYGDLPLDVARQIWHDSVDTIQDHKWQIAILAFCFGNIAKWFLNTEQKKQDSIIKAIADQDFEQMIEKSQSEYKPILITLSTGKVYVGWAVKGPNPEHKRFWIRILPLASGYRDETQKVTLTVGYGKILQQIEDGDEEFLKAVGSEVKLSDLEVVLSFDCIVGMHLFDINLYRVFDPDGALLFEIPIESDVIVDANEDEEDQGDAKAKDQMSLLFGGNCDDSQDQQANDHAAFGLHQIMARTLTSEDAAPTQLGSRLEEFQSGGVLSGSQLFLIVVVVAGRFGNTVGSALGVAGGGGGGGLISLSELDSPEEKVARVEFISIFMAVPKSQQL